MSQLQFVMMLEPEFEGYAPRRPEMTIEVDREPLNTDCIVSIRMEECIGQPTRYTELTPDEARQLARHLVACAEEAEREPAPEEAEADA